jgi:hypothetical protein
MPFKYLIQSSIVGGITKLIQVRPAWQLGLRGEKTAAHCWIIGDDRTGGRLEEKISQFRTTAVNLHGGGNRVG